MTAFPQSRITLRGLKVAEFASEETLCFEAQVYFDGKKVARASNDGRGGCTMIMPEGRTPEAISAMRSLLELAEAFCSSLPPEVTSYDDPQDRSRKMTIAASLENVVDELASDMHDDARLRRCFKRIYGKKVAYVCAVDNGKTALWTLKAACPPAGPVRDKLFAAIAAKHPGAIILNSLTEAAAYELFLQHGVA